MNNVVKTKAFEDDNEVTEFLLRTVLGNKDLKVRSVVKQLQLDNPGKRGARLDVYAEDSEGKGYDIEIQRNHEGAHPRRARYYSSLIDTKMLEPMEDFKNLKDSFVIFITEEDTRKEGKELNRYEMTDTKNGEKFKDGRHIIYVNGATEDISTDVGKLIHDLKCKNPNDMYSDVFALKARYLKETEEGRSKMGSEIERIRESAKEEHFEERNVEIAMNMITDGLPLEKVSQYSGLSIEKVRELAESKAC